MRNKFSYIKREKMYIYIKEITRSISITGRINGNVNINFFLFIK